MKKYSVIVSVLLVFITFLIFTGITGCNKLKNPIKFPDGTFPDTVALNIEGLNSQYDDKNSNMYILGSAFPIIFSSNRGSSGGQFDLVEGGIWLQFDQSTGVFDMGGEIISDPFFTALIGKANTAGNDFGPYSLLSSSEGYEYLLISSQNGTGDLDLYYLKNLPRFGSDVPDISGPFPAKLLNSDFEDTYFCFDFNQDSAYFSSNRDGNFDIYLHQRSGGIALDTWLNQDFSASIMVDSINSTYNDECPFISRNIMVFTSNRPGGYGGYDLYYSVFKNGKWNSPVNFGEPINSAGDEYRPLLGYHPNFTNNFLVFSSNREGGKGGFDLYFAGYTFDL